MGYSWIWHYATIQTVFRMQRFRMCESTSISKPTATIHLSYNKQNKDCLSTSEHNMKSKQPPRMRAGKFDEIYTPEYAIYPLLPYLPPDLVIWECAWGGGHLAGYFQKRGFSVVGDPKINFLTQTLGEHAFDIIITNPPFSKKDQFLKRCYWTGKPFALLLPLTALGAQQRVDLYNKNGIQVIIPNRRINYIVPSGKKSNWFHSAWFCHKMNLPKDIIFVMWNKDVTD